VKKSPCIPQYSGAWIVPPPPPLMHAQSQAIADAVVRERSRLHGFIRRRVPSTADAEDIFQDNWYEFARACSLPDPIEQVGAWLFRVARNRIIDRRSVKRAGLFEATLQKLFTRSAHVVDIVDIGSAFRIITLGGDGLRHVAWTPGDKLQVQLGGSIQRTCTPIDWDAVAGRTRIPICLHAGGPGTRWARMVRKGDNCILFGPRKSIQPPPS
jgi:hypothetical protein